MKTVAVPCVCPIRTLPARTGAFYAGAMRFFAYCFFYFYDYFYGTDSYHPQRTQTAGMAAMKVA